MVSVGGMEIRSRQPEPVKLCKMCKNVERRYSYISFVIRILHSFHG